MLPHPANTRPVRRYLRSKELALQLREECAATEQAKRRRFAPWNGKDAPPFDVATPWTGKE